MKLVKPIYSSPKGGSIVCFPGVTGSIFRSCSANRCVYSADFHSAKASLDDLERNNKLKENNPSAITAQRKTTLKWNADGSLSAVDMSRILDRLSNPALTECELACNLAPSLKSPLP